VDYKKGETYVPKNVGVTDFLSERSGCYVLGGAGRCIALDEGESV
jgi:hypothetical protein